MRVDVDKGLEAASWRVAGRPLTSSELALVEEATGDDFADAAALLRVDAEIDIAGANEFTREITMREALSSLGSKLAARMAPREIEGFVEGLELAEDERAEVMRMLGLT